MAELPLPPVGWSPNLTCTPEEVHKARLTVVEYAESNEDATDLMQMLGLLAVEDEEE